MQNRFEQEDVAYKYLDSYGKAFINGMHAVLELLEGMKSSSELSELVGDYFIDAISESTDKDRADTLKAYDAVGETVLNVASDEIIERIQDEISSSVEGLLDSLDVDFEQHQEEVDKRYAALTLVPDMTLLDDEGYTYGVIKSVNIGESDTTYTIVLADPDEETGKTEDELTEHDVKTFAILDPCPMYVSFKNGKKVSHYKYSGDIEEDLT